MLRQDRVDVAQKLSQHVLNSINRTEREIVLSSMRDRRQSMDIGIEDRLNVP